MRVGWIVSKKIPVLVTPYEISRAPWLAGRKIPKRHVLGSNWFVNFVLRDRLPIPRGCSLFIEPSPEDSRVNQNPPAFHGLEEGEMFVLRMASEGLPGHLSKAVDLPWGLAGGDKLFKAN